MTAHIMLVEDDAKLARLIEMELRFEGYHVRVANDGISGLSLFRQFEPDLAVLDWMMPGLTGVEICQQLRVTGSKVPVILLTARDDGRDRLVGLAAGANDYIVKPFRVEDLLALIRSHLELQAFSGESHIHPT